MFYQAVPKLLINLGESGAGSKCKDIVSTTTNNDTILFCDDAWGGSGIYCNGSVSTKPDLTSAGYSYGCIRGAYGVSNTTTIGISEDIFLKDMKVYIALADLNHIMVIFIVMDKHLVEILQ